MRIFWESAPFRVANELVRRVLVNETALPSSTMLFDDESQQERTMFSDLYANRCPQQEDISHAQLEVVSNKPKRPSFCLALAYDGSKFCGWQRQPSVHDPQEKSSSSYNHNKPSVQGVVEDAVTAAFRLPTGRGADLRVAGRTDAGVHAVQALARLRMNLASANGDTDVVTAHAVWRALAEAAALDGTSTPSWRCLTVTAASDKFHPSFDAKARSYVYLIDADTAAFKELCRSRHGNSTDSTTCCDEDRLREVVEQLDRSLQSLEGQELDYFSFSYGKVKTENTLCCLRHARAHMVGSHDVLAIELTGNRFLRRMVRILVATALQLAITNVAGEDRAAHRLIELCHARDRRRTAKAAPPGGLIFVGATF